MKDLRAILASAALAAMLMMGSATIASAHGGADFAGGHGFGGGEFGGGMPFAMHGDGLGGHDFGGFSGPRFGGAPYPEHFHDGYGFEPEHRLGALFVPRYLNEYDDDEYDDNDYDESCLAYPSYNPHTGTYVGADGEVYHCP
jgi:hypothetical protein